MKNDISKTLIFRFTNKFTKKVVLTVELPYMPFLATTGHYSRLYKKMKEAAAIGFEKSLIKGKKWAESRIVERAKISVGKALIDMPPDFNRNDMEIVKHHLKGIELSLNTHP